MLFYNYCILLRFTTSICDVNVSSRAPADVGSRQARIGNLYIDSKPHYPSAIEFNSIGASGVWCVCYLHDKLLRHNLVGGALLKET